MNTVSSSMQEVKVADYFVYIIFDHLVIHTLIDFYSNFLVFFLFILAFSFELCTCVNQLMILSFTPKIFRFFEVNGFAAHKSYGQLTTRLWSKISLKSCWLSHRNLKYYLPQKVQLMRNLSRKNFCFLVTEKEIPMVAVNFASIKSGQSKMCSRIEF